jgi:hypothetical protein
VRITAKEYFEMTERSEWERFGFISFSSLEIQHLEAG